VIAIEDFALNHKFPREKISGNVLLAKQRYLTGQTTIYRNLNTKLQKIQILFKNFIKNGKN
jgi:hypothetical protein